MVRRELPPEVEGGNPQVKYRMCIDYRKVNRVSKGDAFPVPNMEQMLNRLQKAKFISTLDLSMAYHQIPMNKQSRHITAFVVPGRGIFEWVRMPFGLKGASATFQRTISKVVTPDMSPNALVYIDDVIISSETWEDHLKWLEIVITKIRAAGFSINRKKSYFGRTQVRYLGFLVDQYGLRPDPEKIRPIVEYPPPKSVKNYNRFWECVTGTENLSNITRT